jgi:hypothetical protein
MPARTERAMRADTMVFMTVLLLRPRDENNVVVHRGHQHGVPNE